MKPVHHRFGKCQDLFSSQKWKSNDVINDIMACHAWITCQWRERTDLNECLIIHHWKRSESVTRINFKLPCLCHNVAKNCTNISQIIKVVSVVETSEGDDFTMRRIFTLEMVIWVHSQWQRRLQWPRHAPPRPHCQYHANNKHLSAPVRTASIPRRLIAAATMSSHNSVDGIPSCSNSQAVRRAPWLYGRVSV